MYDFIYFTFPNTVNNNLSNFTKNILFSFKGFECETELVFNLQNGNKVFGAIYATTESGFTKAKQRLNSKYIAVEGDKSWQYINASQNILPEGNIVTGINLTLAIILHNIRSIAFKNKAAKQKILLSNIEDELGGAIAKVFVGVLGNIILVGKNKKLLLDLSQAFFREFGAMVAVAEECPDSPNAMVVDVKAVMNYFGRMNFVGNYFSTEVDKIYNFIFPAALVETVILAGGLIDSNKYNPSTISVENVFAYAKAAKRGGFYPVFSLMQI